MILTTVKNMKYDLYTWYSKRAKLSIKESKKFIRLLMKEEFAFNVFMSEYLKYYKDEV